MIDIAGFAARIAAFAPGRRVIAGLAGPPGAGKSTVAERLVTALNAADPGRAAVLPMDGFHFDDRVLTARGLLARKGAPETFDVGGLRTLLDRLRRNAEPEIAIPIFDRDIEIARAGAAVIPQSVEIVVVEGNYLLLDQPPWAGLAFDLTAMIKVEEAELRRRLSARWRGYDLDAAAIRAKLEENDLPNGRLVAAQSGTADFSIAN